MTDLIPYIQSLRGPVLVIGASGFVGSNLFHALRAVRNDVFACIRRDKGWRLDIVADENVIAVDINDAAASKNLVESLRPQTVFDCAAYGAYSFEHDPGLIYQTNFQALVNLTSQLTAHPLVAYVHAGSSSEYGENSAAPSEDSECQPDSHYSVSKDSAARYLRFIGKKRGFPCVNLRLYSVYGALEDTSRLIPTLLRKAQTKALPPFVDADTARDFIHINDVCAAFVFSAAKMQPGLYGENLNIGTGIKTTMRQLATLVRDHWAIDEEPKFGSMEGRRWDRADWYADPSKADRLIGWRAEISLLAGLQQMAPWILSLSDAQVRARTKLNPNQRRRSISAIIACYKDELAIPVMHSRLTAAFQSIDVDYEIIFVNDGSPDNSAEVIRKISENDPKVVGITHSRNFGSQMAFRSGMEVSTKDSVVLLDGDLQDPPELIPAFFKEWQTGFDVVFGRRIKRDMHWFWSAQYKLFYRVFSAFSYVSIPHDAGDFSLMDKRVVGWLLQCTERDLFMRGLRAYVGFKQTGVDYVRPERMFGRSTNNFLKNLEWAKKGIFSFSNTPLTVLTATGIVSLGFSLTAAVVVAVLRMLFPDIAPRGATTLLIAILVFGSFNLFAIGVVGEYVAKIMTEVKGRPRLIRSALIRNGKSTELLPDGKAV
jgi:polyisoprenyl-phosphate glycosyltransferase